MECPYLEEFRESIGYYINRDFNLNDSRFLVVEKCVNMCVRAANAHINTLKPLKLERDNKLYEEQRENHHLANSRACSTIERKRFNIIIIFLV